MHVFLTVADLEVLELLVTRQLFSLVFVIKTACAASANACATGLNARVTILTFIGVALLKTTLTLWKNNSPVRQLLVPFVLRTA